MKVAIHQPNFFPRIKVLQKITHSDLWVVLDDVQFMHREWQNRTVIRHHEDRDRQLRITVPVVRPTGRASRINEIQVSPCFSVDKTFRTFEQFYRKAPYWALVESLLSNVLSSTGSLTEMNLASTFDVFDLLDIPVKSLLCSQLFITSAKSQRLVDICRVVGSDTYVSGSGGRSYISTRLFEESGVAIEWQAWNDAVWRNVSYIDFLALYGPHALKERLLSWNCFDVREGLA